MKIKKRWISVFTLLAWVICAQSCFQMRETDRAAKTEFVEKGINITFCHLKVGGVMLHYVKTGGEKLPTLFFIHGSPGSWDAYKEYLADTNLLRYFRVIAIDRPGFGYSNFGRAYHLDEQASLIYAIVKHEYNSRPVHLIGHSLGGPIVVKLAQDHPDAYASLTILAGSISPYEEPKEKWRSIFVGTPLQFLIPGAFRTCNTEIYYFKKDLFMMDSGYEKLKMPVTFIHGDKDPLVTVRNVGYGERKLASNKNIKAIIIPGANHFIPWKHFDVIEKHLLTLKPDKI
jgi:pimeloyl-ACP methyl ester carboxylesterase